MEFEWIYGKGPGFEHAAFVRECVFIKEQGYSHEGEFDSLDEVCWHIVVIQDNIPFAAARMYEQSAGVWHIGRVAVLPRGRGHGLGLAMMQKVMEKGQQLKAQNLVLGAQADKTGFYKRLGFTPTGEEYLDEGQPHVMMALALESVK